jgi:hypothetical protein
MRDSWEAAAGDAPFLIEGSYPEAAPADWALDRDGITLTFHSGHRPIQAYSRALEGAGLLIEAIRETRAPDAAVASAPRERRWQRIPMFGAPARWSSPHTAGS